MREKISFKISPPAKPVYDQTDNEASIQSCDEHRDHAQILNEESEFSI